MVSPKNDALQKHGNKSSLSGRWDRLLWYCIALYLFWIHLDYVRRTSIDSRKENVFTLEKASSRRYPTQTITDADYADDIALLANTPTQAESFLHRQGKVAGGICLHANADKTEYIYFDQNQRRDIFTPKGDSLKQVDKLTYLWSCVSSTENDIKIRQAKAWSAIYRLSVIWKSDRSDKIKHNFFQAVGVSILLYWCTTWTLIKLDGNCTRTILNKSWEQHPTKQWPYNHLPPITKTI